jgi:hypothetical protein
MPLSEQRIREMAKFVETDLQFARGIEEAHGIRGIYEV